MQTKAFEVIIYCSHSRSYFIHNTLLIFVDNKFMISKIADKLTPLFPRTLRNAERRARRFWIATRKRTLIYLN